MKKNTKKSLAVVETTEPKPTETQTPKPEPKPAELSVTARLAIGYYRLSINILEDQIEQMYRIQGVVKDAHRLQGMDVESLANALLLHAMLVDLDNTSSHTDAEMVQAMIYQMEAAGITVEQPSTGASEGKGEAA